MLLHCFLALNCQYYEYEASLLQKAFLWVPVQSFSLKFVNFIVGCFYIFFFFRNILRCSLISGKFSSIMSQNIFSVPFVPFFFRNINHGYVESPLSVLHVCHLSSNHFYLCASPFCFFSQACPHVTVCNIALCFAASNVVFLHQSLYYFLHFLLQALLAHLLCHYFFNFLCLFSLFETVEKDMLKILLPPVSQEFCLFCQGKGQGAILQPFFE